MRHGPLQIVFGVLILASDVRFPGVGGLSHHAHSQESARLTHLQQSCYNRHSAIAIPQACAAFAFSTVPAWPVSMLRRPGTCRVSMSVQGSKVNIGSSPRALEPALQRPLNFLKLSRSEDGSEYELCTASITMEREVGNSKVESVELVATVHLGEEDYFRGIQSCAASCDRVLFELVAGPEDLWTDASGRQRLHQTPTPSDSQLSFARRYELQHQLAMINYTTSDTWQLADLERETILRLQHQAMPSTTAKSECLQPELRRLEKKFVEGVQGDALRMAARRLGREATAVWFLRGGGENGGPQRVRDRVAIAAGVALGSLLPAPELSALYGTWVWQNGGQLKGGVLNSLLELVFSLRFLEARRLQYAQFLVAGQEQQAEGMYQVVIGARNKVALEEVYRALEDGAERTAVLYGVLHMRQMYQQLLQQGFRPAEAGPKWRRAWSVPAVPKAAGTARPWLLGAWVLLWLGGLDYSDVVRHSVEVSDCLRFGAQSVVWSTWPHTEIQVPVTQFLQCPSDHINLEMSRSIILYFGRHLWLYWTLQHILFR